MKLRSKPTSKVLDFSHFKSQNYSQAYNPKTGKLEIVGGYQEGREPGAVYGPKALGLYRSWDVNRNPQPYGPKHSPCGHSELYLSNLNWW